MTTVPSPGVQILSAAIAGVASVTSLVPAAKFYGGAAPQGLVLPALVFVSLSRRKLKTLSRSGRRRMFERVKVAGVPHGPSFHRVGENTGPGEETGARGLAPTLYFNDPNQHLLEIRAYDR